VQQLHAEREATVYSECLVLDVDHNKLTLPNGNLFPILPKEFELYVRLLDWIAERTDR